MTTETIQATVNQFGGVVIDPQLLPAAPEQFQDQLAFSLEQWRAAGHKLVWLEVPIRLAALIPIATEQGFAFHHSSTQTLMMTYQLVADAFIPAYASHYIGAGGVVINDQKEVLVVVEKYRGGHGRYIKLPGGALHEGEHLVDGVIREVLEETGIKAKFESLVCFRHWHGYRYGKSDIYFVCRLSPLDNEIQFDRGELDECMWMPVKEYLNHPQVSVFNRRIVEAAVNNQGLQTTWMEGYDDRAAREFFMPGNE